MKFFNQLTTTQRRGGLVLAILVLSLILYNGVLQQRLVNPLLAPLDQQAQQVLQRSLLLSSASFATARLIDRGIAFVSEAQFSVGVASIKPGQMLKPLQDMAVRYSDMMVLAMASVGLQLFLLEFGKVAALPLFGSGAVVAALLWLVGPAGWRPLLTYIFRSFMVLLILVRIGIPLAAVAVGQLSGWVLEPQRLAAEAALSVETAQLQQVEQPLGSPDDGALAWLKQLAANANELFAAVRAFSDSMVEKFIQLIVVYSLQTLIFPLLSLYLLWQLGCWLVRRPLPVALQPVS
ncbi:hypothetical protein GCM10010919_05090 [Alishewanella longhuensis]|uniref:Uncharacterized protein n=1 Tax=Alishewanella longhuensis TaxID=1091037 RepID=A0ABQ3KUF8_9ALTE|nr:hypothetical protein [Alishewanella longhuensis]GHG61039.1 hypothetical protein GCM10010919_05090 [Alishewanella longhuensis]